MNLVNLTPHAVTLVSPAGDTLTLTPTGTVARVSVTQADLGGLDLGGGFTVTATVPTFGDVVDLPDPQAGTVFLVSALVRGAVPGRNDVASPGDLVRDDQGNVKGCRGLQFNPR